MPRSGIVELPLTVEEAMRLLVSGGVIMPTGAAEKAANKAAAGKAEARLEGAPEPAGTG